MVKTVYKQFFALFVLLEHPAVRSGENVVGQSKLLYLEKLLASLLLARRNVLQHLTSRLDQLRQMPPAFTFSFFSRRKCVTTLPGQSNLNESLLTIALLKRSVVLKNEFWSVGPQFETSVHVCSVKSPPVTGLASKYLDTL